MPRRRGALLIGAALVVLVAIVLALGPPAPPASPPPAQALAAAAEQALVAEIRAASRGEAEAPPAVPLPVRLEASAPPPRPAPPTGYAFTAFEGEMRKARMEERPSHAWEESPVPDWLQDGGAYEQLRRQAAVAGRESTYGYLLPAPGMHPTSVGARLEALGGEVLAVGGELLRVRLPTDAEKLRQIAALPEVRRLGAMPPHRKLPASMAATGAHRVPAIVTLMTTDADGRWRRALTELGAEVGRFDVDLGAYVANVPVQALARIAAADFVQAVEPVARVFPAHDTSVPAMGADALRVAGDDGLFSGIGGASVPIGVLDTGLNLHHPDLSAGRESICGANFAAVFDTGSEDQDLWFDEDGHGSHVTGTIVGSGRGELRYAGMAPLVRHIRFAKVLDASPFTFVTNINRGMDYLARPSACGGPEAKALVVNMSLGDSGVRWAGRGPAQRKLDAVVWRYRQLYTVSKGNLGSAGFSNFAAAKNSLAVGAAEDGGDIATFSSIGPSFDGRLKPQVVATGVTLHSVRGAGARSGYVAFSGTSMSSPSTAGAAALLMDAVPAFREQPAALRARLMASAVKPDAFLADPALFPSDNSDGPGPLQNTYGLGKVSARLAVLDRDRADGWTSGSAVVELVDGEYAYQDVEVPRGASRLDVVMTWDERASDTFGQVLLNDLDLWVDQHADCGAGACGERSSTSSGDNTEWVIVQNPRAGTYRIKVVPKRSYVQAPRAALAWTVVRGDSTPQLAVSVDQSAVNAPVGSPVEVTATISADSYVAAGTKLRVDCRGAADGAACAGQVLVAPRASQASREDGVHRPLDNDRGDASTDLFIDDVFLLGEVAAGEEQRVTLILPGRAAADRFHIYLTASAWNARGASAAVEVTVGEGAAEAPARAQTPANDDFAQRTRLSGAEGRRPVDLLLATPEPGEPNFARGDNLPTVRPASVWYEWTAPATGPYRFTLGGVDGDTPRFAERVQLDLFRMTDRPALVALESETPKIGGGLTFAAARGEVIGIRLGILPPQLFEPPEARPAVPLLLRWGPGARPVNDDFERAADIPAAAGEAQAGGSVAGSNQGATVEFGESFGVLAATTWHRWRAPMTGDVRFELDREHLRTAAFVGDAVSELRLVSGLPDTGIEFPVREGDEYYLLVAARSAFHSGGDYTLRWMPTEGGRIDIDDMVNAIELDSAEGTTAVEVDLASATVEPGEPEATGSRTVWWSWMTEESGTYTWRAAAPDQTLQLAAVGSRGQVVARSANDQRIGVELSLPAVAGQRYQLAVGATPDTALLESRPSPDEVFVFEPPSITLQWGRAPANDDFRAATGLGASGTLGGSNAMATVARDERSGGLGDASLWWTWLAPSAAWHRFELEQSDFSGVIAVYRIRGGRLELLTASRRLGARTSVGFAPVEGERYAIRLGSLEGRGEFTLVWGEAPPPARLRYTGRLRHGELDAGRNLLELADIESLAFNGAGDELYVASPPALTVFARGADGQLRQSQRLARALAQEAPPLDIPEGAAIVSADEPAPVLFWDPATRSLIVGTCDGWTRFPSRPDAAGLLAGEAIDGEAPCPGDALAVDAERRFVNIVRTFEGIETYRLSDDRDSLEFVDMVADSARAAVLSADGALLYAATGQGLSVYSRDVETGALQFFGSLNVGDVDANDNFVFGVDDLRALGLDQGGRYLFGVSSGQNMAVFDLVMPMQPTLLATLRGVRPQSPLDPFTFFDFEDTCLLSSVRSTSLTSDVFCSQGMFSTRLLTDDEPELRAEDYLQRGTDLFGNNVPSFRLRAAATSPDGRHAYAATRQSILIVERTEGG